MNRKQLLENGLTESQNVGTIVNTTLAKDAKFIKKAKRELEDLLESAEEALEERLSSNTPLDKSTVEVLFAKIIDLKATTKLYEQFESEVLGE